MKKKNWIKGFDRITVLVAIPVAIWGGFYSCNRYSEDNSVFVMLPEENKELSSEHFQKEHETKYDFFRGPFKQHKRVFSLPKNDGIIAEGRQELNQQRERHPRAKFALDQAVEDGGDPNGTLVMLRGELGFEPGLSDDLTILLPSKFKRYGIGILGAIGFALGTILASCSFNRGIPATFRWVKNGFLPTL